MNGTVIQKKSKCLVSKTKTLYKNCHDRFPIALISYCYCSIIGKHYNLRKQSWRLAEMAEENMQFREEKIELLKEADLLTELQL